MPDRDRRHDDDRRERRDSPAQPTEDERDRRTVFVQQLAARLRTRELKEFFEVIGPVNEAQIVKDRISGRSKGWVFSPYRWQVTQANASTASVTLSSKT
jgi:RNA-binding protein 39